MIIGAYQANKIYDNAHRLCVCLHRFCIFCIICIFIYNSMKLDKYVKNKNSFLKKKSISTC